MDSHAPDTRPLLHEAGLAALALALFFTVCGLVDRVQGQREPTVQRVQSVDR